MCGVSETGDQRESIGECRESSEKVAEGLAELEKSRGIQRCFVCHISNVGEAQKQRQDSTFIPLSLVMTGAVLPLGVSSVLGCVASLSSCSLGSSSSLVYLVVILGE